MKNIEIAIENIESFKRHPLGFFYWASDKSEIEKQRVHIWLPDQLIEPENNCHQHSFDIESKILMGRMKSTKFKFTERIGGAQKEFKVEYNDTNSALLPTGRSGGLSVISDEEYAAGDQYSLFSGEIHKVSILEKPCVTILTTVERYKPVFAYGEDNEEPTFDRKKVNANEINEIFRVFENLLAIKK